jgi:hypothetical protein
MEGKAQSLDPLGKRPAAEDQLLARDIDEFLIDRSFGSCGRSDVGHSERHGDLAQEKS